MAANVRQLRRLLMLLDLIPSGTMEGSEIQHTVELGGFDSAAETGEGQVNPGGDVNFEEASAPARTIAVWFKQRRQVLADTPEPQAVLQSRLNYKVQRPIGQQTLIADGVGQNLLGLLNETGIGATLPDATIPTSDLEGQDDGADE